MREGTARQARAFGLLVALASPVLVPNAAYATERVVCPPPDGAPEKQARTVFDQAVQLEASEPDRALALYQCAASLADRAVIELRIGVVAERLQREDTAIAAFERYLALAGSSAPDVATMKQHVTELRANRAKRAADAKNRSAEAQSAPVTPPPRPPDEEPSRTPLYLGWGLVIGAGVAAGIGSGLLVDAKSKSDEVQSVPRGTSWTSADARDTYDASKRSQTIGIVCFVVAPVLLATGIVVLIRGGARSSTAAALLASPPRALRF